MRARLEPEKKADKLGLTKLEPIKPDIVTSSAIAEPKVLETAERKKSKRVERAMAILSTDDYRVARFGRIPGNSACILWLVDGTMFMPKGIQYFPVENEYNLPLDMPRLEPDEKPVILEHLQWQRGCRPEVREDSKIILREPFGWCVVIDGYMHPITDFLRGLLCKPLLEVQARAAFTSLCETY